MSDKKDKKTVKKATPKAKATPKPKVKESAPTLTGKEKIAAIKKAHLEAVADLRAKYREDIAAVTE
jgi:hypothetical protein